MKNNIAMVAAYKAGFPETVPGVAVHRNCTSSMFSRQMEYYQIKSNDADVIMAGGTVRMSNAQYTMEKIRWGTRMGHSMWGSLTSLGIGPV